VREGDETEAGVSNGAAEFYATLFEIGYGGIDVVTQQVELVVASLLGRVHADFGRREAGSLRISRKNARISSAWSL
jgi:hypothetical protein